LCEVVSVEHRPQTRMFATATGCITDAGNHRHGLRVQHMCCTPAPASAKLLSATRF
jgi:hypothetical protein